MLTSAVLKPIVDRRRYCRAMGGRVGPVKGKEVLGQHLHSERTSAL
jgi:hypothetical protein